jgi:zinc/manganese transport system substrate-binding protein
MLATACSAASGTSTPGQSRVIDVVAAENFWGSIASQLGGAHVRVLSIVTNPNTDPHDYESSASAARAVAEAGYVVQNGAGYDDWMSKLLAASPSTGRRVFNVGAYLGKRPGDNPHLWYNPDYVTAAENHIEADLKALDPTTGPTSPPGARPPMRRSPGSGPSSRRSATPTRAGRWPRPRASSSTSRATSG